MCLRYILKELIYHILNLKLFPSQTIKQHNFQIGSPYLMIDLLLVLEVLDKPILGFNCLQKTIVLDQQVEVIINQFTVEEHVVGAGEEVGVVEGFEEVCYTFKLGWFGVVFSVFELRQLLVRKLSQVLEGTLTLTVYQVQILCLL